MFQKCAVVPVSGDNSRPVFGDRPIQEKPAKSFLSTLKAGQTVTLREVSGRYEISIFEGTQIGHKIIEIGTDYIVVEDAGGVIESTIPVYSIKAIVRIKPPKK